MALTFSVVRNGKVLSTGHTESYALYRMRTIGKNQGGMMSIRVESPRFKKPSFKVTKKKKASSAKKRAVHAKINKHLAAVKRLTKMC